MARRIHAFVQHPHHNYRHRFDPVVHGVAFHPVPSVAWPDVVARWRQKWRVGQVFKTGVQCIQVTFGLSHAPLLRRVTPNVFQIMQGRWREAEFSHALRPSAP